MKSFAKALSLASMLVLICASMTAQRSFTSSGATMQGHMAPPFASATSVGTQPFASVMTMNTGRGFQRVPPHPFGINPFRRHHGGFNRFDKFHRGRFNNFGFGYFGGYGYPYYGYPIVADWVDEPEGGTFYNPNAYADNEVDQSRAAAPPSEDGRRYEIRVYPSYNNQQQMASAPAPNVAPAETTTQKSEPVEKTVLVYRDGHRREVSNYAIMGQTVYLLSPVHGKVALADLDLDATAKENDERGVEFRVPEHATER